MRYWVLLSILSVILIAGCTQKEGSVTSCSDYCLTLTHAPCTGYWSASGTYPNCVCEWVCSDSQPSTDDCVTEWSCSDWSECSISGSQLRSCTDLNGCGTLTGKPAISQSCTFHNFCDTITDTELKSKCNAVLFNDASYCGADFYESCVYDMAKVRINSSACNLINNSYLRNSCKALVFNDRSYCDILEPDLRISCYNLLDNFLYQRAVIENDTFYCGLINNLTRYPNCAANINSNYYFDYLSDYHQCAKYSFNNESLSYQEVYSCFIYHAVKDDSLDVCASIVNVPDLSDYLFNECVAVVNNNFSYCFDFNSSRRDQCFAHFAYLKNDLGICRDSASNDDCLFIIGSQFFDIDACKLISSESLRNSCLYSVSGACLRFKWRDCDVSGCELITNNDESRNFCIYYSFIEETSRDFIYKNAARR